MSRPAISVLDVRRAILERTMREFGVQPEIGWTMTLQQLAEYIR